MPPIPIQYLDCVVYLYKSAEFANEGSRVGGSGFLVGMPFKQNIDFCTIYVVTNSHVLKNCGKHPAIRINKEDGTTDVLVTDKKEWKPHPNASDVAVCPVQLLGGKDGHKFSFLHPELFVQKTWLGNFIHPGDDVFMVGRFVNVQGQQRNTPALRFGNIAMLPDEPIEDDFGIKQESFVIECRSIPGYSGSPVFIFDPQKFKRGRSFLESWDHLKATGPWLLGIDWCHIKSFEPVFDVERQGEHVTRTLREDLEAKSNTSMAGVVPAWVLLDLLNDDEFVEQREVEDKEVSKRKLLKQN